VLERAILRDHFSAMLEKVRTAAYEYERLIQATDDPAIRDKFERLACNQHRHVDLTERLLEILDE